MKRGERGMKARTEVMSNEKSGIWRANRANIDAKNLTKSGQELDDFLF
jgi:hypothetical protein